MAGEATGHRHHILFGDAILDETVGPVELEATCPAIGGEIGIEHHDVGPARGDVQQRRSVGLDDVFAGHGGGCRLASRD